jgi:hypothetical protein
VKRVGQRTSGRGKIGTPFHSNKTAFSLSLLFLLAQKNFLLAPQKIPSHRQAGSDLLREGFEYLLRADSDDGSGATPDLDYAPGAKFLSCAEQSITRVAKSWEDVSLRVELAVERRAVDRNVRVARRQPTNSLRCRDQAEETDPRSAGLL